VSAKSGLIFAVGLGVAIGDFDNALEERLIRAFHGFR